MQIITNLFHGFCMALADSVPGVSGGTVAFLLGFYDKFINSLGDLITGTWEERKKSLAYLIKLGCGWVVGMGLAVIILSKMFETHIYAVSSLFLGFILFAIPVVINEEKQTFRDKPAMAVFILIGIIAVAAITYFNPVGGNGAAVDVSNPTLFTYLYAFLAGAIAICAMILPGISGSTLLLIMGLYLPVITGIKDLLHLDFHALPLLIAFGLGVITGIISIIKIVQRALAKNRSAMLYLIIGMMLGSLYAIVMGPTTFEDPQPPMSLSTFNIFFFIIGGALIGGLQFMKLKTEKKEKAAS